MNSAEIKLPCIAITGQIAGEIQANARSDCRLVGGVLQRRKYPVARRSVMRAEAAVVRAAVRFPEDFA